MCEIWCSHCQPRNAKNPIGLIDRNPKPQLLLEKDTPHVLALSHDNETHRRLGHFGHCCSHGIAFGPETRRASRKHDWLGTNQIVHGSDWERGLNRAALVDLMSRNRTPPRPLCRGGSGKRPVTESRKTGTVS